MKLNPQEITIKQMLASYPAFRIPNYQRDYSWNKEYYSAFLKDIVNSLSIDNDEINVAEYFIGTMVFSGNIKGDYLDVVDGQQRLTVITILLSIISQKLYDMDEKVLGDATFEFIKAKDSYGEWEAKLVSQTSYPYLEAYVQSQDKSNAPETSSEEEEGIKETYDFFSKELEEDRLKKEYSDFDNFEYSNIIMKIRDQILETIIIAIVTPERDVAYEIFEILNAKGKSLASIDLIKNKILEKFHNNPDARGEIISSRWENIKRELRSKNTTVGFATFYRHYWISKYKKTTNIKLYDSFNEFIKPKNEDTYQNFVNELFDESKRYIQIINPNLLDYNNRIEYSWLVQSLTAFDKFFGVIQTRIALLALFDAKKREIITMKQFKNAIQFLENFVFAYSGVLKNQANIYENRFSKFAIELRKSGSPNNSNEIIKEFLYDAFEDRFPTYQDFEEGFAGLKYSKKNISSNTIAKYAVKKISQHYSGRETFWNDSSIEHIINEDSDNPSTLLIGNLIDLELQLNERAEDKNIDDKLKIYSDSQYEQVTTFSEEYNEKPFDFEEIDKRNKILARYYYETIFGRSITNE